MSSRRRTAVVAALAFAALTVPFGIAAHLISEFAGLGWHDDADVAFSARHLYLAILAVVSLLGLVATLLAVPRGDRRARVAELVEALPCRGRGAGFVALSFVAQFAFFAVSQIGEGCPLCGGDIVVGVFAAAVASILGAIAVALGKRRFLEFALALVHYLVAAPGASAAATAAGLERFVAVRATRRSPFAFRYRPPPLAA
jgi:hypothetical protein